MDSTGKDAGEPIGERDLRDGLEAMLSLADKLDLKIVAIHILMAIDALGSASKHGAIQ